MTRVILLVQIAGDRDGRAWPAAGSEITLPARDAHCLVRYGFATYAPAEKPERATTALRRETAVTI